MIYKMRLNFLGYGAAGVRDVIQNGCPNGGHLVSKLSMSVIDMSSH